MGAKLYWNKEIVLDDELIPWEQRERNRNGKYYNRFYKYRISILSASLKAIMLYQIILILM